ncbi:MAG: sigma-54 interaction domain-containing protein [Bacteroidales bacterium]
MAMLQIRPICEKECEAKQELNFLMEIGTELSKGSVDLNCIIKRLKRQLNATCVILTLLNRTTNKLFVEESFGPLDKDLSKLTYEIGEGIIGYVVQTGEPQVIRSISESTKFMNKLHLPLKSNDRNISFICIPVHEKGKVIGTLSAHKVYYGVPDFKNNVQLLTIVASMIARTARRRYELREEIESLKRENSELRKVISDQSYPYIEGNSSKLKEVFALIESVSPTSTTVLLRGESGVGKELIADAIHFNSLRKNKPYIKVNCAALPESLIESELFGHEKGSFTGADTLRIGRFEAAKGGTIFLDEFGDIPANVQVKLLRVIQQREIERLGSTKPIKVDVRIICATNKNLEKMIVEGTFREDLYYRINVFPIYIPPLRDRLHDIPALADHFIARFNEKNSRNIKRITSSAIDCLMVYHWPGNIRELENCIERACILTTDDVIHTYNLPPTLQTAVSSETKQHGSLDIIIGKIEKQVIKEALLITNGNLTKAAIHLGITERIMGLRIRKYQIDPKRFKRNSNNDGD